MLCSTCNNCKLALCDPGFYGDACNVTCSPNCRSLPCETCTCEVCNATSGSCTIGCDSGWFGTMCEYVCPENCDIKPNHVTDSCERLTGHCLQGCKNGFYGNACNITCNDGCQESSCSQNTGVCVKGCTSNPCDDAGGGLGGDEIAGAAGGAFVVLLWAIVVVILICFIWKRRFNNYDVFNRNTGLTSHPHRSSSRRRLRQSSNLSVADVGASPYAYEGDDNEEVFINDTSALPCAKHSRGMLGKRAVTFEEESPDHHANGACACGYSHNLHTRIYPNNIGERICGHTVSESDLYMYHFEEAENIREHDFHQEFVYEPKRKRLSQSKHISFDLDYDSNVMPAV